MADNEGSSKKHLLRFDCLSCRAESSGAVLASSVAAQREQPCQASAPEQAQDPPALKTVTSACQFYTC